MSRVERKPKGPFQDMCYELRTRHRLKHRDVAVHLNVAVSTSGNIESSRFRVVSDAKAAMLADLYRLGPKTTPTRDAFLAASAALPISEETEARRESWRKKNEQRNKSRRFSVMVEAVDGLVSMLAAEGRPCECTPAVAEDFDVPAQDPVVCTLCKAMMAMGIPEGYSTPELALGRLEKFHAKQEAAR